MAVASSQRPGSFHALGWLDDNLEHMATVPSPRHCLFRPMATFGLGRYLYSADSLPIPIRILSSVYSPRGCQGNYSNVYDPRSFGNRAGCIRHSWTAEESRVAMVYPSSFIYGNYGWLWLWCETIHQLSALVPYVLLRI